MFLFETNDFIKKNKQHRIRKSKFNHFKDFLAERKKYSNFIESVSSFYLSIVTIKKKRISSEPLALNEELFASTLEDDLKIYTIALYLKENQVNIDCVSNTDLPSNTKDYCLTHKKQVFKMLTRLDLNGKNEIDVEKNKIYLEVIQEKYNNEKEELEKFKRQNLNLIVLTITSSFEILVSNLLRDEFMQVNTQGGDMSKFQRKYKDIVNFDNVIDIKMSFVDKYIEDLLYHGFEYWIDESVKTLTRYNIKNKEYKNLKASLSELYQRRNLIVHNNNNVNEKYISNVKCDLKIGSELEINQQYVEEQLQNIITLATTIIFQNFKRRKLYNKEVVIGALNNLGITILKQGIPELSSEIFSGIILTGTQNEKIIETLSSDNDVSESQFLEICNFWLVRIIMEDVDKVHQEINYMSKNGMLKKFEDDEQYDMAMSILLNLPDAADKAINFLKNLELGQQIEYQSWPIFNLINQNKEFIDYKEELYYS